uniref:Diamine acetyltransferase 2 n=1 Tax=Caligus rogercresseyi TaxID=217165 RepID=C1BR60_CALRO|nr:Diamine acetyltransferase 2 [Caligus rogercresseyi]ACO11593.1 Diamine acetyltransferase 2 [Caligus rogercresseyi]|eukprot:TRINITY_DN5682_c0_g1_i1.p1 TRINITY_DN5682_c0_g1~~TRINITY_DN5682_c0_g1_i1.p1  ORF type:complete len:167 (+),score=28.07 TRINITY_DN5682_c0_g1_i1:83-583(+)
MIFVRDAVREDCKALLHLIMELVDYHDMLKSFKVTLKMLEENGFGDNPTYQCKIAFDGNEAVGHCLYAYKYSTFKGRSINMEDLYVKKTYRGQGIGKMLWQSVCKSALENGCSGCSFMVDRTNTPAIGFYKAQGAINKSDVEDWNIFQLTKDKMIDFVNTTVREAH